MCTGDAYMKSMGELVKMRERLDEMMATKPGTIIWQERPLTKAVPATAHPYLLIFDVDTSQGSQDIYVDKRYYRLEFGPETESGVELRIVRKNA